MSPKKICLSLIFSSLYATSAFAEIALIAKGSLLETSDLATATAALLENGLPGNIMGGGSGLTYIGGNKFISLPDRGPNANPYNAALSDTTSYIARFHVVNLKLSPSSSGLPFTLAPTLTKTTLLHSFASDTLTYGSGIGFGVGSGEPALNTSKKHYFTGRADNFDPSQNSLNTNNARLDPEAIRMSNDRKFVYIADEYGPYVYQFRAATGRRTQVFTLPSKFAASNLNANGDAEIASNTVGRVANKGMEGLAISPDGKSLVGIMQSPLAQDGGTAAPYTRLIKIDIATGATSEYAYPLSNIGTETKPKYPSISEIVAINNNEFLVDERDGKGLGDNSAAVSKKIYRIDLSGSADVSNDSGSGNLAAKAVSKTLFLDLVTALNANGVASTDIPAKIEGLSFGPDLLVNNVRKHTLYIANDNDFIDTVIDSNHPAGIANPNQFFVFSIDPADLPTYVAQKCDSVLCGKQK
jgi:hypothetical protein